MDIQALIASGPWQCECGKRHAAPLRVYARGTDALNQLPDALRLLSERPCPQLVFDPNTFQAAHERVTAVLDAAGIPWHQTVLQEPHPHPDEHTVGAMVMDLHPESNIVVAVGSGVLNDCCKLVGFAAGMPSVVVATAPSMDGYASNLSSMARNGIKVTIFNQCPDVIIADTALVATAPDHMLWAGLGDMLAKYVALCEWRISALVTGEYYCEAVAELMRKAVRGIVEKAGGLMSRNPQALEAVMDGLVLSGLAMSYAETSRPAAGLEHQFSHVWDMSALAFGTPSDLHGTQVGVGTLICLKMYEDIARLTPDPAQGDAFEATFDQQAWEERLHRVFGKAAPELVDAARREGRNDMDKRRRRVEETVRHWPAILNIIKEELPDSTDTQKLMASLRMPLTPADLGISPKLARDALWCSRDIRDKYVTSSMLWDLGLLYRDDLWLKHLE